VVPPAGGLTRNAGTAQLILLMNVNWMASNTSAFTRFSSIRARGCCRSRMRCLKIDQRKQQQRSIAGQLSFDACPSGSMHPARRTSTRNHHTSHLKLTIFWNQSQAQQAEGIVKSVSEAAIMPMSNARGPVSTVLCVPSMRVRTSQPVQVDCARVLDAVVCGLFLNARKDQLLPFRT
jgi:hypothetical protein